MDIQPLQREHLHYHLHHHHQAHLDLMIILFQAIVHHFFPPLATRTQQHLISVLQLRVISMVYHLL